jgi:hypothetical protein
MKRPLVLYVAPIMLFAKSATLSYMLFGSAAAYRPRMFLQPLLFLAAAVWLYVQPKWARWLVGAFFVYATFRECTVLPTFQGSTLDLIRRPFSLAMAAWFAWALLFGRDPHGFIAAKKEPSPAPEAPAAVTLPARQQARRP